MKCRNYREITRRNEPAGFYMYYRRKSGLSLRPVLGVGFSANEVQVMELTVTPRTVKAKLTYRLHTENLS